MRRLHQEDCRGSGRRAGLCAHGRSSGVRLQGQQMPEPVRGSHLHRNRHRLRSTRASRGAVPAGDQLQLLRLFDWVRVRSRRLRQGPVLAESVQAERGLQTEHELQPSTLRTILRGRELWSAGKVRGREVSGDGLFHQLQRKSVLPGELRCRGRWRRQLRAELVSSGRAAVLGRLVLRSTNGQLRGKSSLYGRGLPDRAGMRCGGMPLYDRRRSWRRRQRRQGCGFGRQRRE
jgi:hypothetical protein